MSLAKRVILSAHATARDEEIHVLLSSPLLQAMRASGLVKRYGWGVHYDGRDRMALVAGHSPDCARFRADAEPTKISAMRSTSKEEDA